MNKVIVGKSGSPNLKQVRSKIGSLMNTNYKPGGGDVKIESHKLEWKPRISLTNDGDKKVYLNYEMISYISKFII